MSRPALLATLLLAAGAAHAQMAEAPAVETEEMAPLAQEISEMLTDPLAEYLWVARPVVIFAPSANDPRLIQQLSLLEEQRAALDERDVVVLTDTDPTALSPLRKRLRPHDFQFVLIGKDGEIKLRKPFPWSSRELMRTIDKMPLRQQELRARRNNPLTQ